VDGIIAPNFLLVKGL